MQAREQWVTVFCFDSVAVVQGDYVRGHCVDSLAGGRGEAVDVAESEWAALFRGDDAVDGGFGPVGNDCWIVSSVVIVSFMASRSVRTASLPRRSVSPTICQWMSSVKWLRMASTSACAKAIFRSLSRRFGGAYPQSAWTVSFAIGCCSSARSLRFRIDVLIQMSSHAFTETGYWIEPR